MKVFCSDMRDPLLNAAAKQLPLASRAIGRFHVAKDGVAHMDKVRRRIQKGAGNGRPVRCRARKPAVNCDECAREHAGEARAGREKRVARDALRICDEKHSRLRQASLVLRLCYIWQDAARDDREACDKALYD